MDIRKDIIANKNNTKGLFIVLFFRLSSLFTRNALLKIIGFPIRYCYKVLIEWVIGCEISDYTPIGPGLAIYHGQGIVVNETVQIGECCTLRQNITIGNSIKNGKCPIIGDNVDIGANSVIIGEIYVGDNSIIGAGSVVVKDVPPNAIVAGNPARIIRQI